MKILHRERKKKYRPKIYVFLFFELRTYLLLSVELDSVSIATVKKINPAKSASCQSLVKVLMKTTDRWIRYGVLKISFSIFYHRTHADLEFSWCSLVIVLRFRCHFLSLIETCAYVNGFVWLKSLDLLANSPNRADKTNIRIVAIPKLKLTHRT